MTFYYRSSNHFTTYECDNIPDHRSRFYGCSNSELAHRKEVKNRTRCSSILYGQAQNVRCFNQSTLLFHIIMSSTI